MNLWTIENRAACNGDGITLTITRGEDGGHLSSLELLRILRDYATDAVDSEEQELIEAYGSVERGEKAREACALLLDVAPELALK